ncbi:MAG: thioredoxin [Clostridiales bacterium]|nr:thioredoxin [Clostridiales bacterium]
MNKKAKQDNTALKFIVPLLIVVAVVAIGLFKLVPNITRGSAPESSASDLNPDFAYEVKGSFDIEKLKSYNLPIIIEFGADWCPPCQQMAPIIKSLNAELQGKAIIRYVNVDKVEVKGYNFQSIPTQLFINADGSPYVPTQASPVAVDMFADRDTNEHVYTLHTGVLTRENILTIFKEMGME